MSLVLVVDDEPQIRRALRTSLEAHGYDVATVGTGTEGVVGAAEQAPDLVLLDLGLPDIDGTEVIKRVRAFSDVPVIVLSVRESQSDKVAALDAGADDYVTKPFGMEELLARARAAMRRTLPDEPAVPVLGYGRLEVDLPKRLVTLDDEQVRLTPDRVRVARGVRHEPRQAAHAPVAPAEGLGPGVWHRDDLPAHVRSVAQEEARRRRPGARADRDRARRRLSMGG